VKNWAKDVEFKPAASFRPDTVEAVRRIVDDARRDGRRVRTTGMLHSSSSIIAANEVWLSTRGLDRILSIDPDAKRVVLEPGVRFRPLLTALEARGLTLENTGGVLEQTIAGALTCDTHGTGREQPPLNAMVTRYRFIDGRGEDVEVRRGDDGFDAIGVSLGLLGVIVELELRCVPLFCLENDVAVLDLAEMMQNIVADSEAYPRLQYLWYTDHRKVVRSALREVQRPAESQLRAWVRTRYIFDAIFSAMNATMRKLPFIRPAVTTMLLGVFRRSKAMTLPSHAALSFRFSARMHEAEVAYPIEATDAVLEYLDQNLHQLDHAKVTIGVRFCAASACYLSPVHGRDSLYITLISVSDRGFDRVIALQTEMARRFEGRFHWGKKHPEGTQDLLASYTAIDEFERYRQRHDPDRVFTSPYFDALFSSDATTGS